MNSRATMQRNITVPICAIQDDLLDLFISRGWVTPGEVGTITPGRTKDGDVALFLALEEVALDKQEGGV